MKNVKLSLLSLSFLLLVASCKKDDFSEEAGTNSEAALSTTGSDADAIGWKSPTQWETTNQETFSVQYVTIADSSITADVADNGLVLLYKKNGTTINALPFEEENGNSTASEEGASNANYWYHQVMEGSLLISRDVYNAAKLPDAASSFKYFVITPEKLQNLESEGHTTEELMSLNYADAAALLQGGN